MKQIKNENPDKELHNNIKLLCAPGKYTQKQLIDLIWNGHDIIESWMSQRALEDILIHYANI